MRQPPTLQPECYDAARELPIGWLALRLGARGVAALRLLEGPPPLGPHGADRRAEVLLQRVLDHLLEGGAGPSIPLEPQGTPFQRRVWTWLRTIPRGETRTYGEVARALDTVPRAVGGACRANPVLLLVPCHRVVAAAGAGGFAGQAQGRWADAKRWLLEREGARAA
jgi:methylated-DNA-[protein]-cysteine S-methyltransferase